MTFFSYSGARVRTTVAPVSALCQIMYSLVGLFWRNDLRCASVIPSEQTASSYIILYVIPKTIGNRKRDCAWGCTRPLGDTTWENLQIEIKSTNQFGERNKRLPQSEKFLDLGTVTRPPGNIYARVNCFFFFFYFFFYFFIITYQLYR